MIDAVRLVIAVIMLLTTLACSENREKALAQEKTAPTLQEDSTRLAAMKQEIEELAREPRCSQVSECAVAAFGRKPCGGPWTYLVYSRTSVDESALVKMIGEYNELNQRVNERHGLISDCMLVTKPSLDCVSGLCVVPDKSP